MPAQSRRSFLTAAAASAGALVLEPLKSVAASAKPVRITGVDGFPIRLPVSPEESAAGKISTYTVARVDTDAGVRGYSFAGPSPSLLDKRIRPALVGQDLFALERHLQQGLLEWGGLEHAIWDAIGKIAGQPVYRLLGGAKTRLRAYLTCVWPGNADQSHVPFEDQVKMAVRIKQAGFRGMKIRAWRPRPLDDVEVCREIRAAVGPEFSIMFDRTAEAPQSVGQKVWDYETALRVARGLEKHGALWLEEPFARNDFTSPAKLCKEVDIPITGGEGYLGLESFHQCLLHGSYDILQPEGARTGGIWTCRKVAAMAQASGRPCILHGTMGLRLAGWLQCSAAFGAEWQEMALITPPLLPEEQWSPGLKVLKQQHFLTIRDGHIEVPDLPGIGLDVDEEALARFRS
jgi:L-alanine-DL-glutamate epimerase-like enolase superfamily enzyme